MSDQQYIYPRGSLAMGSGDLIDITDFKMDVTSNAKQEHTLRKQGAGISGGNEETTITFNAILSEFGEEADYLKMVKKKTIKQVRIKVPLHTFTCNGAYKDYSVESTMDGAIKLSATFVGHLDD